MPAGSTRPKNPYCSLSCSANYTMKAYKLYTTAEGHSAFEEGTIIMPAPLTAPFFLIQEDDPARSAFDWHPAPRKQYVITLRGSLEFTVTDGSTFIIHPGDVLLATDVTGSGHKWRRLSEESWIRAYIALEEGAADGFLANGR